jgi:cellulose synthase (UDP-forming)
MSRPEALQHLLILVVWVAANGYFWAWWLRGGNVGSWPLFVSVSAAIFYVSTVLCSAYIFFLGQMRRPVHIDADEARRQGVVKRVAVITLTVPGSESIEIVERQLRAMRAIEAPHDSWILVDKVHSPEIERLAERLGVRYFSRHDTARWGEAKVAFWNQPSAPFQTKTKAGNVNSWLNAYGGHYSHFTQLDIDHLPAPNYLDRVLGYFVDP